MLKVSGLKKSYGKQVIFDGVDFVVGRGERVGLVGRNGHGKSTLFRIILGLEEPDAGEISLPRHYRTGHLSQHLKFSEDTVLKEACLSLPVMEDGTDESYKAEAVLMGLGIQEGLFHRDPSELSGGYQVRLSLAKVLVSEPDLLLLDEPTNYLDIVSVRWLGKFLRNWRGELMLITHDRDFMDSITTHTVAIHRLKIRKVSGPTRKLYSQIVMEEEIHEQTRLNEDKKRKETEKFINRFRASATKASAVQSRIKALEKKGRLEELSSVKTLDFEFNGAPFMGKWLMEAKGLSFGYADGSPLFSGLNLSIGKRDRIAIIGKNGKGKTTLLNVLAGEVPPSAGSVIPHQNLKIAYFGQTNIERLNPLNTIEEELIKAHPDYSRAAARRAAGVMMFEGDAALKKIDVLSGGEKSRVLMGKLLLTPANMLLLDEPTNHLDMESIDSLIEAVDAFDGAVMIVTHSEMILDAVAERLIVFDGGGVALFEGSYREFLEKVGWESERAAASTENKQQKGSNRKELRKIRADLISERQKALGPIKKRMAVIEEEIVTLEKSVEEAGHELLKASERAEAGEITRLSKIYHASKDRIDVLFDMLDAVNAEHDSKSREFEERLNGLGREGV